MHSERPGTPGCAGPAPSAAAETASAARVFATADGVAMDSAGLAADAECPLGPEQLAWTDVIFVMEKVHRSRLSRRFGPHLKGRRVICLDIPDDCEFMAPERSCGWSGSDATSSRGWGRTGSSAVLRSGTRRHSSRRSCCQAICGDHSRSAVRLAWVRMMSQGSCVGSAVTFLPPR